ncbi:hypothetical protein DRO64_03905, partial [Candidatus Bathyarchaeota archaeon]
SWIVDGDRGELILAEEAYIGGRYGDLSHSQDYVDSLIWQFTLISDKNKSYDRIYPLGLRLIFKPGGEVKTKTIEYRDSGLSKSIAPNIEIEEHILFRIPIEENPRELYFK